jgi:hypothetical protein
MKRLTTLLAILTFTSIMAFAQKTYEMVVETNDGSSTVFNTVNIKRTYFRERTGGGNDDDNLKSYLACPDDHHPHLIDLGLPSGTKWACCNVDLDASKQSPTNFGGYYAWGDTEEKDVYDWDTYLYWNDSNHDGLVGSREVTIWGNDIAGTEHDAAQARWGHPWVMPSIDQIRELLNNCTHKWTKMNDVNGELFTGPSGGNIFLPAAGYQVGRLYARGTDGYYWSSTQSPSSRLHADVLRFNSVRIEWGDNAGRDIGYSVRPVSK